MPIYYIKYWDPDLTPPQWYLSAAGPIPDINLAFTTRSIFDSNYMPYIVVDHKDYQPPPPFTK